MAWVDPDIEEYLAHLPEVQAVVRRVAETGRGRAVANLAAHRRTGAMHIEMTVGDTDAVVSLVDPDAGALAAEVGRTTKDGTVVAPLNILGDAFDL